MDAARGHADAESLGMGAGAILGGLVGGRFFRLLTRVVVARVLGAASLGLFDLAWTVAYLLAFATPLGLPTAVVQFGAALWRGDPGAFRQLVRSCVGLALAFSSVAAAALLVFAEPLARLAFGQPELVWAFRIVALLIPLSAGLEVLTAATRATQSMRYTAYFRDLMGPAIQFALFAVFLGLGYGLGGAFLAVVLGFAAAFGAAALKVRRMLAPALPPIGAPPTARRVLAFSLPVAVSNIIGMSLIMVDRLIVGALRPPAELGIYSASAQLAILSALIVSAFTTTLIPRFADLRDRGATRRLADLYKVSTRWGLYLIMPVAVVLLLAPGRSLVGLFGDEFASGASVLLVLMVGQLVAVGAGPVGVALMTGGHERRWLAFNGAALVLNIALDLVLIPRYGILGAAWASAAALVLRHGVALVSTYRQYGIRPYDRHSLKLIPALVAAGAGVLLVQSFVPVAPFWALLLSLAVSWAATAGTLLALGFEPEDKATVGALMGRLGLRRRQL